MIGLKADDARGSRETRPVFIQPTAEGIDRPGAAWLGLRLKSHDQGTGLQTQTARCL